MNYNVIDDKLHIATCKIEDLTIKQVQHILMSFGDDSSIKTLTVFYDSKEKMIVFNSEHEKFEEFLLFAKEYLNFDDEVKKMFNDNCKSKALMEIAGVLDSSMPDIKAENIRKLVRLQYKSRPYDEDNANEMYLLESSNINNTHVYGNDMYNLGYIHGKRAERARKKA